MKAYGGMVWTRLTLTQEITGSSPVRPTKNVEKFFRDFEFLKNVSILKYVGNNKYGLWHTVESK